ncbi:hypothetical protein BDZ90DRAFT_229953 [Jaminaea rosea]|uniref:Uncharacterized protein n=1 Tax=Jaminaea rosea TaxID=1569628 RepID=A0A316V351_9BASI|nr:hypothetical protein BDZ90DRAFT_229953 [Jaminaea rosea]PWN30961.1 hypothetical protein BDZ90DRAFT_229953 [Jaminaea rosea]
MKQGHKDSYERAACLQLYLLTALSSFHWSQGPFDCSLSLSKCQRVCLDAEDVRARFATEIQGGSGASFPDDVGHSGNGHYSTRDVR